MKEYMLDSFRLLNNSIEQNKKLHAQHLQATANKFASVDKRVESDLYPELEELKLQADDAGQRLYAVQMEQIKPLKEQNARLETEIMELKKVVE